MRDSDFKKRQKHIDTLVEKASMLVDKIVVVDGNKITIRKTSKEYKEYIQTEEEIQKLQEELDDDYEDWLEENCDILPVEIIGQISPILGGGIYTKDY